MAHICGNPSFDGLICLECHPEQAKQKEKLDKAVSVIRDSDWWGSFGDRFGWKLHSFTRRESAAFIVPGTPRLQNILPEARNTIEKALEDAYGQG